MSYYSDFYHFLRVSVESIIHSYFYISLFIILFSISYTFYFLQYCLTLRTLWILFRTHFQGKQLARVRNLQNHFQWPTYGSVGAVSFQDMSGRVLTDPYGRLAWFSKEGLERKTWYWGANEELGVPFLAGCCGAPSLNTKSAGYLAFSAQNFVYIEP